jgi:hypothetical protein
MLLANFIDEAALEHSSAIGAQPIPQQSGVCLAQKRLECVVQVRVEFG